MKASTAKGSSLRLVGGLVDGARQEVRCQGGVITHVSDIVPGADRTIFVDDCEIIPGLHDHHIHLLALAAADLSIRVGCNDVRNAEGLRTALRAADPGWVRVVGYHESVAGDIDRAWLDQVVSDQPARVQHRSGRRWILNSAAIRELDLESNVSLCIERDATGELTGRITGADEVLRERIPPLKLDFVGLGQRLASYGVTGVSDLTPTVDAADFGLLASHCLRPDFPLSVLVTGSAALDNPGASGLAVGPVKIVIGDHERFDFDGIINAMQRARRHDRNVAIHAVTAAAAALAIAGWNEVGSMPGDRLEHGAILSLAAAQRLVEHGIIVVTQPAFIRERGDQYLRDVDPSDLNDLWRCASLAAGGVSIAAGTDAPYGSDDPWDSIAGAIERTSEAGISLGSAERLRPIAALNLFLGSARHPATPRRIAPGQLAHLCVLDEPLERVLQDPSSNHVVMTVGRSDE